MSKHKNLPGLNNCSENDLKQMPFQITFVSDLIDIVICSG